MALPLSLILVFASEILRIWLGPQYAAQSAGALRWLAVGVFANSLANPLFVALYAKNRPDLPAKFHLLELVVHVPLTIYLIRLFGITGAAAAWTTRAILDMCLLLFAAARVSKTPVLALAGGRVSRSAAAIVLLVAGLGLGRILTTMSVSVGVAVVFATSAIFAASCWRWMLGDAERAAIAGTMGSYVKGILSSRRGPIL